MEVLSFVALRSSGSFSVRLRINLWTWAANIRGTRGVTELPAPRKSRRRFSAEELMTTCAVADHLRVIRKQSVIATKSEFCEKPHCYDLDRGGSVEGGDVLRKEDTKSGEGWGPRNSERSMPKIKSSAPFSNLTNLTRRISSAKLQNSFLSKSQKFWIKSRELSNVCSEFQTSTAECRRESWSDFTRCAEEDSAWLT